MPCERCAAQFTVLRRKRACPECGRTFCGGCVRNGCVCAACRILCTRPLVRHTLDTLRVRDMQCFLQRRHVSTAGCVEKEDLVNLVISHVNSGDFARRPPQSEFAQTLASIKGFANNVLSALDIGSHGERSNDKSRQNTRAAPHPSNVRNPNSPNSSQPYIPPARATTSTQGVSPTERQSRIPLQIEHGSSSRQEEITTVPQCIVTDTSTENTPVNEMDTDLADTNDCLEIEDDPDDWELIPPADPLPQDSDVLLIDNNIPLRSSMRSASDLDLPTRTADNSSREETSSLKDELESHNSSSRINLGDLKDLSQVEQLKVKQLKELLILNRVDFKGCCERNELLERAKRLWRESTKSREDLENPENQEMCRICMDAPMECVMLECGHIATCVDCGKRLAECPICRGYVVRVVRFFRS